MLIKLRSARTGSVRSRRGSSIAARRARERVTVGLPMSAKSACALRLIGTERVERRALMKEARLGRDRDHGCRLSDQDRLPQLMVPAPEAQGHALEGSKVELGAEHEAADLPGVCLPEPGHGFADRANGDPRLVIDRAHGAIGPATEAILELGGTPELMSGVPGRGHEPLRAGDRARVPGPVWDVVAELSGLVGDDRHVVVDAAREDEGICL